MSESRNSSQRLPWVDYVKGINISLIVGSHCCRGLQRQGMLVDSPVIDAYGAFVYSFTMPLFFFMSGLFITSWATRLWPDFLKDRGKSLAYPYFLWVWIHGLALIAAGGLANHTGDLRELAMAWYDPPFHLWFIYALFFISVLYVLLRKLGLNNRTILILTFIWLLTREIFPTVPWAGYYLTRNYAVYFVLGAFIGRQGAIQRFSNWGDGRLVAMGAAGLGVVLVAGWIVQGHTDPYTRLVLALIGGIGTVALATWLQRHRYAGVIELVGRRSLEVFLAHAMFAAGARALLVQGLGITTPLVVLPLLIAAGILGPIALLWGAQRVGFPYLFTLKRRHPEHPVQGGLTVPAK